MDSLNTKNHDLIVEFKEQVARKTASSYLLAISRDGEYPVRSIYFYDNAIEASAGYEAYSDWGFAKDFLTVTLYEPTGRVHEKVLKRPRGGECTFVKDDYLQITEALMSVKHDISEEIFNKLIVKISKIFSKDNQRFSSERFLSTLGYIKEVSDSHE